jgi:hypothetical protein
MFDIWDKYNTYGLLIDHIDIGWFYGKIKIEFRREYVLTVSVFNT